MGELVLEAFVISANIARRTDNRAVSLLRIAIFRSLRSCVRTGEDEFGGVKDRHRQQSGTAVCAWLLRSEFEGRVRAERWKIGRGSEAIVSVEEVNQISGGKASIETNNRKQKIKQGSGVAQPRVF